MSQQVEEHISRFQLKERLAATSLATLYRAEDPGSGRAVAVKALRPFFSEEPDLLAEFFATSRTVAGLNQEHILAVFESGEDGSPWAAMDFMDQGSLAKRVGEQRSIAEVTKLLTQLADALEAAHQAGLVHGDIKPSNVFLTESGDFKVADFGMARLASGAHPLVRSSSNTPMPSYMSPEQALDMTLSKRSDVFSLAVLAYHMLTGRVPYQGSDPTTIWAKQLRKPPPRPDGLNSAIPPGVSDVLLTAISTNPEKRHGSARELADAFSRAAAQAPSPTAALAAPTPIPEGPTAEPATDAADAKAGRRHIETPPGHFSTTGRRIFCRVCGRGNDATMPHCQKCWATLWPEDAVEAAVTSRAVIAFRLTGKRGRAIPLGATALGVLIVAIVLLTAGGGGVPAPKSSVSALAGPTDWVSSQRGPTHTGYMPGPTPELEGTVKWLFQTPEILWTSPAVVDGVVFLATGDRRVLALDAESGQTLWEHAVESPIDGTPAVTESTVYVGLRASKLLALDRATGERRWEHATGGPIFGSPTVKDGVVYVGDLGNRLSAVDAQTGELLWKYTTDGWLNSSPAISDNGVAVLVSQDGNVYFIDTETGKTRYVYRTVIPAGASPSISGDTAIIGTESGSILALDLNERRRPFDRQLFRIRTQLFIWNLFINDVPHQRGFVWINTDPRFAGSIVSTPALTDDRVYVATRRGRVYSVDKFNSRTDWVFRARGAINHSTIVVGDRVFVGSDDGAVYGLDATSGDIAWEWAVPQDNLPSTSPVFADGILYIGTSQERPTVTLFQIDEDGIVVPEEDRVPGLDWHYRYGASPCSPGEHEPVGPFFKREGARTAALAAAPTCGVLYAIQ